MIAQKSDKTNGGKDRIKKSFYFLKCEKCIRPCFSKTVKSAIILKKRLENIEVELKTCKISYNTQKRLEKNIEVELYTCQIN